MRWIDRGPEPPTVAGYAQQFTQGWVEHYQQNRGQAPPDSFWREYRESLGARSNNECWYCGRQCTAVVGDKSPTVDHFRPRRRFPELTYQWSNWVFSCQRCNESKGDLWPETGYVDPCAVATAERPEQYFDYAADTGEILPRNDLSVPAQRKAWDTIYDFGYRASGSRYSGLNAVDLMTGRWEVAQEFEAALLEVLASFPAAEHSDCIAFFVETESPDEFTWVTRIVVERVRQAGRL